MGEVARCCDTVTLLPIPVLPTPFIYLPPFPPHLIVSALSFPLPNSPASVQGSIRSWDKTWGGYIVSPEVPGSIIALVGNAPHISEAHVGCMVFCNLVRHPETGALWAVTVELQTGQQQEGMMDGESGSGAPGVPVNGFAVTVKLPQEVVRMGVDMFPAIPPEELAAAFPVIVAPGQTVLDVTETMCQLVEDVCNIYTVEGETPGFEPLCLLNTRLRRSGGGMHPLPFNEQAGMFLRDGDALILDGEFIDLEVQGGGMGPRRPETEKLPVTIITGFLGSGKTTFLKYILMEQRDKKFAVIENEFGQESIDSIILGEGNAKMQVAEKMITMDNGCMCCTVRGDVVEALLQVLEARVGGAKFDGVFIETTGLADPAPIVKTFMECVDPR